MTHPPNGSRMCLVPLSHLPHLGPHMLTGRDPPLGACARPDQSNLETKEEA
jgi:hypothetical protein